MPPRYVLIANPETKRCRTYLDELAAFWASRGDAAEVEVVPWAEVIVRDGNLNGIAAFDRPAIVRMESPGKDISVARLLLEAGARDSPAELHRDWQAIDLLHGKIVRPGLLYRGFRRVLGGLRKSFDDRHHLAPTSCPLAIAEMFDKTATAHKLAAIGVPIPEMLGEDVLGAIDGPAAIQEQVQRSGWLTAYVKLNTGSSATGIVVLQPARGELPACGITSLAAHPDGFYNTRAVRRVTGDGLWSAIGFVLDEGAIVQRGIPMAQVDGQNFDVRIVCIYGKPSAVIFRLSSHPMTNLHLGGRRGDYQRCRAVIPVREWLDALDHCEEAASCFDSAVAGVDLVFEQGCREHNVLELNAFGDFFPGWVDGQGKSVHALEIEATAARK